MLSKEEYYHSVLKDRGILEDARSLQCTCPNTLCEWHGNCQKCVALHRCKEDHLPVCLQPMLRGKLQNLARMVELEAVPMQETPLEYRLYVHARDKLTTRK